MERYGRDSATLKEKARMIEQGSMPKVVFQVCIIHQKQTKEWARYRDNSTHFSSFLDTWDIDAILSVKPNFLQEKSFSHST